jgi:hypothetical protein
MRRVIPAFLIVLMVIGFIAFPCHAMNQLVASGSVTQANMRISAVDGTAFIDFTAADVLTGKLGNLLVVKDSSGRTIQGWIKSAGSSETLSDTEQVVNGDFSASTGWNVGTGWAIGSGVATGTTLPGNGGLYRTVDDDSLKLLKVTIDVPTCTAGNMRISYAGYVKTQTANDSYYMTGATTSQQVYLGATGFSGTIDNLSIKQVIAPSATGVTIVNSKGGSTYNFAAKNSSFNYNDSSGYTYRIYKTPAVPVASGSVTAANTQLSLVDGTAFAYLVGVDLSAYQTGKHILAVYNSTSGALIGMGYCSATPPAGETLDTEIATGTLVIRRLYKITATEVDHFGTGLEVGEYFVSAGTETCDANNKVQQVLDPPSTGVRIVSAKAGATQNWLVKGTGAVNSAISYKIYYVGD